MSHKCPANNCPVILPTNILMCREHWRQVPRYLRMQVGEAWRRVDRKGYFHYREQAIKAVNEPQENCQGGFRDAR
jgi:hypothetical protein